MISLPSTTRRLQAHIVNSLAAFLSTLGATLGRGQDIHHAGLSTLRPATRLLMIGLIVWIGLVLTITVTAILSVKISTLNFSEWFGGRASAAPSSQVRTSASLENILQRPLFSRIRQSAVAPTATLVSPLPQPGGLDQNFTLKGVFISGELAKAFLISAQKPLGVWVQTNEEIAGWRVASVKPDHILLEARNERLVIPLFNGVAR